MAHMLQNKQLTCHHRPHLGWSSSLPYYKPCFHRHHQHSGTHPQHLQVSRSQRMDGSAPLQQPDAEVVLEQLSYLRRQLEAAVSQEDYAQAKRLKEQADALKQQLSPVQQYVQHQLEKLRSGSLADQAEAIKGLGEVGDEQCLPDLAACLADPGLKDLSEAVTAAMWAVFSRHPNPQVQVLMKQGMSFLEMNNLPLALEAFDAACKLEPSFAEAHNKRATVLYLMKDYKQSIEVCELVLQLNPYHFGAASGAAICYMGLGDFKAALMAFERTLEINPALEHIRHYVLALRANFTDETGSQ